MGKGGGVELLWVKISSHFLLRETTKLLEGLGGGGMS